MAVHRLRHLKAFDKLKATTTAVPALRLRWTGAAAAVPMLCVSIPGLGTPTTVQGKLWCEKQMFLFCSLPNASNQILVPSWVLDG
jgi:hypothetical protein